VSALRRVLVLLVTPWIVLCLYGTSRASAAPYPDSVRPSTVQVLPASQAAPAPHGVTDVNSPLPFTGTDALVLVCFAAAVLIPGVGLLIVSRRQRGAAQPI
jgi:hypothetical protein